MLAGPVVGNSLWRLMVGREKVDNKAECEKNPLVRVDLAVKDVY
jgi:hypothetical protein